MSEMISNIPALGILFDVEKIESGGYGIESWKIFWRAIKGEQFNTELSMFDGDLMENDNIYCIGIQTFDQKVLDRIKKIMEEDTEYKKISANPNFIEGYNVIKEPLPGSGVIKYNGNFIPKGQALPAEVAYDETIKKATESEKLNSVEIKQANTLTRSKEEIDDKPSKLSEQTKVEQSSTKKTYANGDKHESKTTAKNKTTAGLLAIFLGGIGAHKFYLGKPVLGILYLVFCWTFVPMIFGIIEGILYLTSSDEKFYTKYVKKNDKRTNIETKTYTNGDKYVGEFKDDKFIGKSGDIADIIKAVSNRDVNAVTDYIKSGGDINAKDQWGNTALVWGAHYGYTDIVKLLIDAKANLDLKDVMNQTALMKASDKGHTDIVKILISVNADVNVKDIRGQTALIMASQNGHADIVKLLIDAKANVDTKDKEGLTALRWAEIDNHNDVVGILKAAGDEENSPQKSEQLAKNVNGTNIKTKTFADGSKYVGEWRDGKMNGQGTHTGADGSNYVGEWKDDLPNGQGTKTLANGAKYEGEFMDGKRNGQGTEVDANGHIIHVGEFKDGKFIG